MLSNDVFRCDDCAKTFNISTQLKQHTRMHIKPFRCESCAKCFSLRSDLQRHVQARHRVNFSKLSCAVPGCGYKASRKDHLGQHQIRKHGARLFEPQRRGRPKKAKSEPQPPTNSEITVSMTVDTLPAESPSISALGNHQSSHDDPTGDLRYGIFRSAASGDVAKILVLLELGGSLDATADDGSNALHVAARAGQLEMIQFLLNRGMDQSLTNDRGRTPLHEAVLSGVPEAAIHLVDHGANLDARDRNWRSAWDYILKTDNARLAEAFIPPQAEKLHRFLISAFKHGSKSIPEILLQHFSLPASWEHRREILRAAIRSPDASNLRLLLPKWEDKPTLSWAFCRAATQGRKDAIQAFLDDKRTDSRSTDFYGKSALINAAESGYLDIVELLLQQPDCEVRHEDRGGRTALERALQKGHLKVASMLLDHQESQLFREGVESASGRTKTWACEPAIEFNQMSIVREILFKRAWPSFIDRADLRPTIRFAAVRGRWEIVRVLMALQAGYQEGDDIYKESQSVDACAHKRLDVLRQALDNDSTLLNYQDPRQSKATLLHWAATANDLEVTESLLGYDGIHINSQTTTRRTALHVAVVKGYVDVARLLLSHIRIDVNTREREQRRTALHMAAGANRLEVVKLLIAQPGIDVNARDWQNVTALHLAVSNDNLAMVETITSHPSVDFSPVCTRFYSSVSASVYARRRWFPRVTALQLARQMHCTDPRIVDLLVAAEAKLNTMEE